MINIEYIKLQAKILSRILKPLNAALIHHKIDNQVLWGNYNTRTVIPTKLEKKHFGQQAILDALAKSEGYSSFKGLCSDHKATLNPNFIYGAINHLNPFKLSICMTEKWTSFAEGLSHALLHSKSIDYNLFSRFISHGATETFNIPQASFEQWIKTIDHNFAKFSKQSISTTSSTLDTYGHYFPIALSIYISALKLAQLDYQDLNTGNIITRKTSFNTFLHQKWDKNTSLQEFINTINKVLDPIYGISIKIIGKIPETQCDAYVQIIFSQHKDIDQNIDFDQCASQYKAFTKLQAEAFRLHTIHSPDENLYTLKDLSSEQINNLNGTIEIPYGANPIYGTKQFWINAAPALNCRSIDDIQEKILDQLTFVKTARKKKGNYEFHFEIKKIIALDDKRVGFTPPKDSPQFITIYNHYKINEKMATLMVHSYLAHYSEIEVHTYGHSLTTGGYDIDENYVELRPDLINEPSDDATYLEFAPEALIDFIQYNDKSPSEPIEPNTPIELTIAFQHALVQKATSPNGINMAKFKVTTLLDSINRYHHLVKIDNGSHNEYSANDKIELEDATYLVNHPSISIMIDVFLQKIMNVRSSNNTTLQVSAHPNSMFWNYKKMLRPNEPVDIHIISQTNNTVDSFDPKPEIYSQ